MNVLRYLRPIFLSFGLTLTSANMSYAQLENYLWWYGPSSLGLGIQFDHVTKQPSPINGKYAPYSAEGCSVISDPHTGTLLYYADGIRVVDASHRIMPNGGGLLGNNSSAQNGWSCPVPGQCNKYYVFSNSCAYEANNPGTLYYSIVDMSLPGNGTAAAPLGDVQTADKNIMIINGTSEAICLIKGSVRDEFWMLAPLANSASVAVLKITSAGIVNQGNFNTGITLRDIRNIRYSEQSGKFVILALHGLDPLVICDFNNTTGQISNPYIMPGTPFFNINTNYQGAYDAEWSPDGTKLYISLYRWYTTSTGGRLYQYDLNQALSAPVLIYNNGGTMSQAGKGIKLGPDRRIYWLYHSSVFNNSRYIGVINAPDQAGAACDFDPVGLDMGVDQGNANKFPDFLVYNNASPFAVDDIYLSPCIGIAEIDLNLLDNDSDADADPLSISVIKVAYGSALVLPDNSLRYTKPSGAVGMDTVWYEACDDQCPVLCDTAMLIASICDPLPVTLVSFYGKRIENRINLYWTTSSEVNSDYFTIEKSIDGINFEKIGELPAKEYSSELVGYTYVDCCTEGRMVYYRLKAMDKDVSFSYSEVISFSPEESYIEVSPNPVAASAQLKLVVPGSSEIHVSCTDLMGRVLLEKDLTGDSNIFYLNLENFPSGVYIFCISHGSAKEIKKVIVK